MDNIYTYFVPLPNNINEMIKPCYDGYTVYISNRIDHDKQVKAYNHALEHIKNADFDSENNVNELELERHGLTPKPPVKRKNSKWEKYHKKMLRKERALAKLGYRLEWDIIDDEYGCPKVKYKAVKEGRF